jgi:hypothetical protein
MGTTSRLKPRPCRHGRLWKSEKGSWLELPFCVSGRTNATRLFPLWHVEAECSPNHVVDCLGLNAHGGWHVIVAGPPALGDVRVLDTPPQTTLRAVIELVPEVDRTLDIADVARAGDGLPTSWQEQSPAACSAN